MTEFKNRFTLPTSMKDPRAILGTIGIASITYLGRLMIREAQSFNINIGPIAVSYNRA